MTTDLFRKYQEETFDSFCKRVIRHESADAHRELATRAKYETQMSALPVSALDAFSTEDTYHLYCRTYNVLGRSILVHSQTLGEALQFIIPQHRNIILLYYFLDYSDVEIGRMLGLSTRAVLTRRMAALRRLQQFLEEYPYE